MHDPLCKTFRNVLMKISSHPGHGTNKSLNEGNWTSWILKRFHLSL